MKTMAMKNRICLFTVFFVLLGTGSKSNNSAVTTDGVGNPKVVIDSKDVHDYICIVNKSLHPNIDSFVRTLQSSAIKSGDKSYDQAARGLEGIRRGGTGSGFVYVDTQGRNYIITNYHVIVGAFRFSATFEVAPKNASSSKGNEPIRSKIVFQNLTVLNADEENDLAILAFPDEDRPFRRHIPLYTGSIRDDNDVRAAGYPGTAGTPSWAFSAGTIVNARAKVPGTDSWFIQHGAVINPGNSGGPLLIQDKKSNWGYSVAGINTFYIKMEGSPAFFAIPSERAIPFIQNSFKQLGESAIKTRIDSFTKLLNQSSTDWVYRKLAAFLSSSMIAANPEAAVQGLSGNQESLIMSKIAEDMPLGIGWAVAHNQIEMYIAKRTRNVQAEFLSLSKNNFGGYTVRFLISGYPYRSEWIKEWGDWRIDTFFEDDGEYNDHPRYATPYPIGKRVLYTLQSSIDVDWYMLDIPSSGNLTVRTEGNVATRIVLVSDPSTSESLEKTLINSGRGRNARASGNVQAGNVYVAISLDSGSPGEYALIAEMGGSTVSASPASSASSVEDIAVTIVNNTGYTIVVGGIWPSDQEPDASNLKVVDLGSNLGKGNSRRITLSSIDRSKAYFLFLVDTDEDMYIKRNIKITPNMTITFNSTDLVKQ